MSYKRALEADARLAARNALKIRAALRQTFDPKRVYEQYLLTQPNQSDSARTKQRPRPRMGNAQCARKHGSPKRSNA
jgi:hypothetical protein